VLELCFHGLSPSRLFPMCHSKELPFCWPAREDLLRSFHLSVCHFKDFCSVQSAQKMCSCDLSKDCVLYVPFHGATALISIEDMFLETCSCSYCLCSILRGSCSVLL